MSHVKTAISLDESLFHQIEAVVDELKLSRSHFFAMIAEEYLRKRKNQKIVDALNEAYADGPDEEEIETMRRMLKNAQKIMDPW